MLKRLSILLITILMVVPAVAQPQESCECMYAPKKGQFQVNLSMGQGQFFNDFNGLYYLLPNADGTSLGLGFLPSNYKEIAGLGNNYISADLSTYAINIGSLNLNDLTNIAGVQMKYFLTNHIDINLSAAYNVNLQPHKDYIEGEYLGLGVLKEMLNGYDPTEIANIVGVGDTYASKAILGAVTHSLFTQLGADYYFDVQNPRVHPYLGLFGQFKMARVQAYYPYTGQTTEYDVTEPEAPLMNEFISMYRPQNRAGQLLGFGGGLLAGVEYSISEGLIIGIEVAPVAYQYTLMHLNAQGQDDYYASNHNIRAFTLPQLKFGIRF